MTASDETRLIAGIMGQMATDAAFTSNALISSLTIQARTAEATIALMRRDMDAVLSGPYMPNVGPIADAMSPTNADVQGWLESHYPDGWRELTSVKLRCFRCPACQF